MTDAPRPGHVYGALDLAKLSGVSVGEPCGIPVSDTWNLGKGTRPERFVMLRARLIPWLLRWRPMKVFIEEPLAARIMVAVGATLDTQLSLTGYVAIAEAVCAQYNVPTALVSRQAVLQHFTGQKSFADKDDGKRACVVRCKQLRYPVEGFDQADAAALWDFGWATELPRDYAMLGARRPLPEGSILSVGNIPGTRKASGRGRKRASGSLPLFRKR